MKILSVLKNSAGFTLVQAIFVVVVLSILGVAMMKLIGVQSSTSVLALQGARGYQAARSGLEWGAARASAGNSCSGTFMIEEFTVNVTCSRQQFTEGSIGPYDVYRIGATATFGTYGTPEFVLRRAEMKVGFP